MNYSDAERIDWLQDAWRDGVHVEVCAKGNGTTWHAMAPSASVFVGPKVFTGKTLRKAIDAAISAALASAQSPTP